MIQRRSFIGGLVASVMSLVCGRKAIASTTGDITSSEIKPRIEAGVMVRTRFKNDYLTPDYGFQPIPAGTLMLVKGETRICIRGQDYVDQSRVGCSWMMEIGGGLRTCYAFFGVWQLEVAEDASSGDRSDGPSVSSPLTRALDMEINRLHPQTCVVEI
jgi:hypothetical protein